MARILLIGSGPLPEENPERLGFSQLRTDGFLQVLLQAGHDVRLLLLLLRYRTNLFQIWIQIGRLVTPIDQIY